MLKKTSILFSTNCQKKDNIPLRFPNIDININGLTVQCESSKLFSCWHR